MSRFPRNVDPALLENLLLSSPKMVPTAPKGHQKGQSPRKLLALKRVVTFSRSSSTSNEHEVLSTAPTAVVAGKMMNEKENQTSTADVKRSSASAGPRGSMLTLARNVVAGGPADVKSEAVQNERTEEEIDIATESVLVSSMGESTVSPFVTLYVHREINMIGVHGREHQEKGGRDGR